MADNTTLNAGTGGDTIRDIDRTTAKTQVVALDLNPAGSETLMAGSMPVTGTFWQATQPVSGAVSVSGSVAVTGTFFQATQPVSIASAVAVTGTFWQATQPVSFSASENHLGAVGGNSVVVGGTFTRPADTTAYAAGDLVANSTTAGSVVPIPCAVARLNAGTGVIRRIRLATSNTALTGAEVFRVHLFKTAPTVANGDNGVFSANGIAAIALGFTDVTMTHLYSDGAKGFTATDIVFDAAAGSQNIYALVEARTAYTPASAATFTLALEVLQD